MRRAGAAAEHLLEGAQEQRGGQQDAEDGQGGGQRPGPEAAGEDLELSDEAREAGQSEGGEGGDGRHAGEHRCARRDAGVGVHVVGAAAFVEGAGEEEEGAGEQAVTDHLGHRAGHRQRLGLPTGVSGRGGRADGEDDVAHVVHRRVGDHPLEVGLGQGDECSVEDRDDTDDDDHGGVTAPGVGQHRHGDAQEAVGAHLQQHPGQDGGARGGRLGVREREPGVERHGRCLDRQPDADRQQHRARVAGTSGERVRRGEVDHVEGVRGGGQIEPDEAEQQHQRTEERVEEEHQRRACPVAVAPAGDDEVHAHDGQIEEDEEQDQVQRDEQTQARRFQEQEQRRELADPAGVAPGSYGAGREQHAGQAEHRQGQPVDTDVVADARAGDPPHPCLVLHPPVRVVAGPQDDDESQQDDRRRRPDRADRPVGRTAGSARSSRATASGAKARTVSTGDLLHEDEHEGKDGEGRDGLCEVLVQQARLGPSRETAQRTPGRSDGGHRTADPRLQPLIGPAGQVQRPAARAAHGRVQDTVVEPRGGPGEGEHRPYQQ